MPNDRPYDPDITMINVVSNILILTTLLAALYLGYQLKFHRHRRLHYLVKDMNYPLDDEGIGVCNGVALSDQMHHHWGTSDIFLKTLKELLDRDVGYLGTDFSANQRALCDTIALNQRPNLFDAIFFSKNTCIEFHYWRHLPLASALFRPDGISPEKDTVVAFKFSRLMTKNRWISVLSSMCTLLEQTDETLSFRIIAHAHTILFKYSPDKQQWYIMDTNYMSKQNLNLPMTIAKMSYVAWEQLMLLDDRDNKVIAVHVCTTQDAEQKVTALSSELNAIVSLDKFELDKLAITDKKKLYIYASQYDDHAVIEGLLPLLKGHLNSKMLYGTPLQLAVYRLDIPLVKKLLNEYNVNPNETDGAVWPPLCIAVWMRSIDIVNILLAHKDINPNTSYKNPLQYDNPLHIAACFHEYKERYLPPQAPRYLEKWSPDYEILKALLAHPKIDRNPEVKLLQKQSNTFFMSSLLSALIKTVYLQDYPGLDKNVLALLKGKSSNKNTY